MRHVCLLLLSMAIVFVPCLSQADFIYWQIDLYRQWDDWEYARASYQSGETYRVMDIYDQSGKSWGPNNYATNPGLATGAVYSFADGFKVTDTSAKILIELFSSDNQMLTQIAVDYAGWNEHAYADMQTVGATPLAIRVAPEPTSGFLSLLGLAALVLRRKRRSQE